VGEVFRPLSVTDPALLQIMEAYGWAHE